MNENLAKYRRFVKLSQRQMAEIAGIGLTAYRYKESGNGKFTQEEIIKIYLFLKAKIPNLTIEQLFFNDLVI